jgi:hypothetical protein
MKVTHKFQTSNEIPDPEVYLTWAQKLTQTAFGKKCALCNTGSNIQMHHLRAVKDVRTKMRRGNATFAQWQGAVKRKQIPLCQYHHQLYHKGQLNYADLTLIKRWP